MISKLFFVLAILISANTYAASPSPTPAIQEASPDGEAVDVSKVTEKYWAQGKDTELGVVQNRKYTSEHRFELDFFAAAVSTDPFLSVHAFGGSVGYYFTQYFSAHFTAWKDSVSYSDAYNSFKVGAPGAAVYLDQPKSFYGVEFDENFLYGKASLFGSTIIYVDIYALAGAGVSDNQTGNDFTSFVGLGQKIHLNQYMTLNLDTKFMFYNETVQSSIDNSTHTRSNSTNVISLGLGFLY
jgi:outer membrane beta-barrel protein